MTGDSHVQDVVLEFPFLRVAELWPHQQHRVFDRSSWCPDAELIQKCSLHAVDHLLGFFYRYVRGQISRAVFLIYNIMYLRSKYVL